MKLKKQQKGLTFLGLLVVGILLAFAGVVLAQVVPTYIEYMAVQKAVQKASTGSTVSEVRSLFDKASQIDDIKSVTGKDLEIGKEGDRVVVSFAYTREIPLFGPAYLLMKYEGASK
jgi:Zn-dependent membrane protease YugP